MSTYTIRLTGPLSAGLEHAADVAGLPCATTLARLVRRGERVGAAAYVPGSTYGQAPVKLRGVAAETVRSLAAAHGRMGAHYVRRLLTAGLADLAKEQRREAPGEPDGAAGGLGTVGLVLDRREDRREAKRLRRRDVLRRLVPCFG